MDNDKIVPAGEILVYQTEDGKTRVECRFEQETVWLSQALIGELFQVSVPPVNEHLKNIFEEAELAPEATIRKFRIVLREGQREVADFFGLQFTSVNRIMNQRSKVQRKWS